MRNNNKKEEVQPIVKEDGSVAVTDEEIFQMKLRYGKETLDVKKYDEDAQNYFTDILIVL